MAFRGRLRSTAARGGESGQALLLALGGSLALVCAALALVAIAGAVTGKGRAQRAADLAAISAARSLRDDLPRLLSPAMLPDGTPNPSHLEKADYMERARATARDVAEGNGVDAARLRISFPDGDAFAPVRVRAAITALLDLGEAADGAGPGGVARSAADRHGTGREVEAVAVAEAGAPASVAGSAPTTATGGGYGGPLVYRNGEGMRPDVGTAFDRMAAAAARDDVTLVVNSGFRSDAEQAALFAAHPDPRWVAPPGKSLHRCATELDLGPDAAYGWLAANATRFGFIQRYSWEAWHYGYAAGPAPCSAAGDAVGNAPGAPMGGTPDRAGGSTTGVGGGGDGALAGSGGLPEFVPARFRASLLRAAAHWNVSAALLAAQLMAESNFNPYAQSPAGAQGIAQFIPSTAAAYGLHDPFDPEAAIDAQAHLMHDLLTQFGSPQLALAAYNAGPAPVAACDCVPAYPETQAYITRILALLDGAGAFAVSSFEVRLVG